MMNGRDYTQMRVGNATACLDRLSCVLQKRRRALYEFWGWLVSNRRRHRKRRSSRTNEPLIAGPVRAPMQRIVLRPVPWLAVQMAPHRERRVADAVGELGLETYRPTMAIRCVMRHRVVTVERSAAPGYLFVAGPSVEEAAAIVREYRDVREEPIYSIFGPIKPFALQLFCDHLTGAAGSLLPDQPFIAGQNVIVQDGPFTGHPGIVQGMTQTNHVVVDVGFLGRLIAAAFAPDQITAVTPRLTQKRISDQKHGNAALRSDGARLFAGSLVF